jgi:3D (Asp-Asp-Asp) domain-containing protein
VSTTQYVRFGKPSITTGKVTLYECTYNEAINRDTSVYPYYGVVYSSGSKKVTVIDTESSSTAYTTGSVEIQVSLS